MPQSLHPQGKDCGTHWRGGWVGPRASMDAMVKRKRSVTLPGIEPWFSSSYPGHYTDWAILVPHLIRVLVQLISERNMSCHLLALQANIIHGFFSNRHYTLSWKYIARIKLILITKNSMERVHGTWSSNSWYIYWYTIQQLWAESGTAAVGRTSFWTLLVQYNPYFTWNSKRT
jgi:hypothetical protein